MRYWWWILIAFAVSLALLTFVLRKIASQLRSYHIDLPFPPDGVKHPSQGTPIVVLVHGFWGYSQIGFRRIGMHYFNGVCQHLAAHGITAFTVRLPPGGSVPERGAKLAALISDQISDRFMIIGHSLGGLDARYLAAKSSLRGQLAVVVTIGCPHRGTPLADAATTGRVLRILYRLVGFLRFPLGAVPWLTTAGAAKFNAEIKDDPRVFYGSVVGAKRSSGTPMSFQLWLTHRYLNKFGANDGVVPLASQPWGTVLADIEADHLAQIGWGRKRKGFSAPALYLQLVETVAAHEHAVRGNLG
jgi:triacylglycerol lipase